MIAGRDKSAPRKLLGSPILEDAEQPELLAARALSAYLVEAAHVAVHSFPAATARVAWGWRVGDVIEDGIQLGADLGGTPVEELVDRTASVPGCVVDDCE